MLLLVLYFAIKYNDITDVIGQGDQVLKEPPAGEFLLVTDQHPDSSPDSDVKVEMFQCWGTQTGYLTVNLPQIPHTLLPV